MAGLPSSDADTTTLTSAVTSAPVSTTALLLEVEGSWVVELTIPVLVRVPPAVSVAVTVRDVWDPEAMVGRAAQLTKPPLSVPLLEADTKEIPLGRESRTWTLAAASGPALDTRSV
jgi:hypothetical protein